MKALEKKIKARESGLLALHYSPVRERRYTATHPQVLRWTRYFHSRCGRLRIFESFWETHNRPSKRLASIVGTQWYRFSSFMPWFLCRAASEVGSNRVRHYVIQTAFEELGERDEAGIHPEIFREAVLAAGVAESEFGRRAKAVPTTEALSFLRGALLTASGEAQVLGILLGLEIPAEENIETVFRALAHNAAAERALAEHRFFRFHRLVEPEHVRLTVANFLRFCGTESKRQGFLCGFDQGVAFWERFWSGVSRQTISRQAISRRKLDA